jgi:hypothetical protein
MWCPFVLSTVVSAPQCAHLSPCLVSFSCRSGLVQVRFGSRSSLGTEPGPVGALATDAIGSLFTAPCCDVDGGVPCAASVVVVPGVPCDTFVGVVAGVGEFSPLLSGWL